MKNIIWLWNHDISEKVDKEPQLPKRVYSNEELQEITIRTVCETMGVDRSLLLSPLRKRNYSLSRQMICYLLINNKKIPISKRAIGKLIGGKDHSTVVYAINTVQDLMDTDMNIRQKVKKMQDYINQY